MHDTQDLVLAIRGHEFQGRGSHRQCIAGNHDSQEEAEWCWRAFVNEFLGHDQRGLDQIIAEIIDPEAWTENAMRYRTNWVYDWEKRRQKSLVAASRIIDLIDRIER